MNITVSLPSGQSCVIAVQSDTRVEQLQPTIERSLKVPKPLQRLIAGNGSDAKEIQGHYTLKQAGILDGGIITVARSWPEDEGAIVAIVELMSKSKANHNQLVAASIVELLDRENARIQIAAIQALSWMGDVGAVHVERIAGIIHAPSCPMTVNVTAMEALSWMGTAGAAFASTIAMYRTWSTPFGGSVEQNRALVAIRDMFWSEDWQVRQIAMESFVQRPVHSGFVVIHFVPLMIEACFDEEHLVRLAAASALAEQIRLFDNQFDTTAPIGITFQGWVSNAGLHMLDRLSNFGDEILKSKASIASASDLQQTFLPLLTSISLAAAGEFTPPQAESKSVKKAISLIRVAAINLLGRLFQAAAGGDKDNFLSYLSSLGVHNKISQARKIALQWLVDIYPEGACTALSVSKLLKKDKKEEVLKAAHLFFEAYADLVDFSSSGGINTDVVQLCGDNDEESEYYWSYDDYYCNTDDAENFEEYYWNENQEGHQTKSHGGAYHDGPSDKKAIRKHAQLQQASTAEVTERAEKHKACDRRRRGARDAKCADVGRLLLSSSLGQGV